MLATAKIFRDVRDSQVSVNDDSVRHCKGCHKGDGQFMRFKCAQIKNVDNGVNLLLSSLDEVQCHTISTADIERTSLAKAHVFTYRKTKQVIHC